MKRLRIFGLMFLVLLDPVGTTHAGETLYNGIELPDKWPPKRDKLTREPTRVPYLENKPKVIPIDVGRQLFVDDFLIESTTLKRTFHTATYHEANPLLTADRPWESANNTFYAAPFSDGVWYDAADSKFKMWYLAGDLSKTCYAESDDGMSWRKPKLDIVEGTNIVHVAHRDSATIWLDHAAKDPSARYKYFAAEKGKDWQFTYRNSADGIRWSDPIAAKSIWGDRSTVFYNPFRKVWCLSQRIHGGDVGRARAYTEDRDPMKLIKKSSHNTQFAAGGESVFWLSADKLDPHHPNPRWQKIEPQLYNFDAVAYESIMLGFFTVWQGPDNRVSRKLGNQKRNDVLLGFSRDGFHFARPDRRPFIGCNEVKGAWNWGNVQSAGGGCLVVGDKLYVYISGRALDSSGRQGRMSTGLATLRRDGFASMDAGEKSGTLTTRPLRFNGKYLHVNADCPTGQLKVEVLDKDGKPIPPFTLKNCLPISCDKTLAAVTWTKVDLSTLSGRPVRLRFHIRNGSLFSFWVSSAKSGASNGYVAAGGPGFTAATDTVGHHSPTTSPIRPKGQ